MNDQSDPLKIVMESFYYVIYSIKHWTFIIYHSFCQS